MNQLLAQMFGTDKIASAAQPDDVSIQNFTKVAAAGQLDIENMSEQQVQGWYDAWQNYTKIASDNGIDISAYSVEQVAENFGNWIKEASGGGEDQADYDVKVASEFLNEIAAETYTFQKQAADAEAFGQIAAHSYFSTLQKLANEGTVRDVSMLADPRGTRVDGTSSSHGYDMPTAVGGHSSRKIDPSEENLMSSPSRKNRSIPERTLENTNTSNKVKDKLSLADKLKGSASRAGAKIKGSASEIAENFRTHGSKTRTGAKVVGGLAAAGALAAGGKAVYDKVNEKKASFDRTAARYAIEKLAERGIDPSYSTPRLEHALGQSMWQPLSDDVKIASAQDAETAVATRAVELIDLAGYELRGLEVQHGPDDPDPWNAGWSYRGESSVHAQDSGVVGPAHLPHSSAGVAGQREPCRAAPYAQRSLCPSPSHSTSTDTAQARQPGDIHASAALCLAPRR